MEKISANVLNFMRLVLSSYQEDLEKRKQSYIQIKEKSGGNPERAAEIAWGNKIPGWGDSLIPLDFVEKTISDNGINVGTLVTNILKYFKDYAYKSGLVDLIPYVEKIKDLKGFSYPISQVDNQSESTSRVLYTKLYNFLNLKLIALTFKEFFTNPVKEKEFLEKKYVSSPITKKDILSKLASKNNPLVRNVCLSYLNSINQG